MPANVNQVSGTGFIFQETLKSPDLYKLELNLGQLYPSLTSILKGHNLYLL